MSHSGERERTAGRLLTSSAEKFYDPEVDIDWDAPLLPDKHYQAERWVSLYGTELWRRLSPEQRVELGKHEIISITTFGIFAEVALMHLLLNAVAEGDPVTDHARYALTEIADECRHSTMFSRAIEKSGVRPYLLPKRLRKLLRLAMLLPIGPASYGATLLVEDLLDRMQRENLADESLQPIIRMINRIHVLEEARHMTFARGEIERAMPELNRFQRGAQRFLLAVIAWGIVRLLIDPRVYRSVGLDPRAARKAAMTNPVFQRNIGWMAERSVRFLDNAGLIGFPGKFLWRRSFLLAGQSR